MHYFAYYDKDTCDTAQVAREITHSNLITIIYNYVVEWMYIAFQTNVFVLAIWWLKCVWCSKIPGNLNHAAKTSYLLCSQAFSIKHHQTNAFQAKPANFYPLDGHDSIKALPIFHSNYESHRKTSIWLCPCEHLKNVSYMVLYDLRCSFLSAGNSRFQNVTNFPLLPLDSFDVCRSSSQLTGLFAQWSGHFAIRIQDQEGVWTTGSI